MGDKITMSAELINFLEDDQYIVTWEYSQDEGETFAEIEDANDLEYSFELDNETVKYLWKLKITLYPKLD